MRQYTVMTFCFSNRPATALNLNKYTLQLQSWQTTIAFRHFLRGGGCEDNFWKIIAEIVILLFLRRKIRGG